MNRIELTRALIRSVTALFIGAVLTACGGGADVAQTTTPTLSGVAAVGYPIVGGTVSVVCAAGVVPSVTTSPAGAWLVPAAGLTLPCAVRVSGGIINGVTSTAKYHSLAISMGTVNITPLTDLIVANFAGTSTPDAWFTTGLTPAEFARITPALVDAALDNLRAALAELTPLDTFNPITTVFTPTTGNTTDDMLVALKVAMTTTGVTHAALLSNASLPIFTPPTGFGAALTTAFAGTVSGGAMPLAPAGLIATAGDGQVTITWAPVAGATSYKLYMSEVPGISLANPANMHHLSVSSPFIHPGLINGTTWYFVVTASNGNGESIGSTEVSATPQALALPVVTLTAAPASITSGATSTLSWSSTNSTSCTSSGGGGTGTTGTFTTPALTATATYTVTCTGAGGITSQNATVTVAGTTLAQFSSVPGGCVRDNVTGLMWEVKTTDGLLRDWNKTYTNYDSTLSAQKYDFLTGISSNPTQAEINAPTNSVGFKNAVNATNLCGFSDWRLPTVAELQSIVKLGSVPTIDTTWFPNTQPDIYWSASPLVGSSNLAWGVYFDDGGVDGSGRSDSGHVRLVRAGQ